jgi:hypothetical protein
MAKTIFKRESFLKNAGLIDGTFLDVNNLPRLAASVEDEEYVINAAFSERPDLLAYTLYGSSRLWWVFALRNPNVLKDPIRDFKEGVKIFLPSSENVNAVSSNR